MIQLTIKNIEYLLKKIIVAESDKKTAIKEVLDLMQQSIDAGALHFAETGDEFFINNLNDTLNQLNKFLKSGLIQIPELKENDIEKNNEIISLNNLDVDDIVNSVLRPTPPPQTTKPTYINPDNIMADEIEKTYKNKANNIENADFIQEDNKISDKKDDLYQNKLFLNNAPTTKPTYISSDVLAAKNRKKSNIQYKLTNNDNKLLQDIQLPESKVYIYKELKQQFGDDIETGIYAYGINKFCRDLIYKYPERYKKTEIKNVISNILTIKKNIYEKNY